MRLDWLSTSLGHPSVSSSQLWNQKHVSQRTSFLCVLGMNPPRVPELAKQMPYWDTSVAKENTEPQLRPLQPPDKSFPRPWQTLSCPLWTNCCVCTNVTLAEATWCLQHPLLSAHNHPRSEKCSVTPTGENIILNCPNYLCCILEVVFKEIYFQAQTPFVYNHTKSVERRFV